MIQRSWHYYYKVHDKIIYDKLSNKKPRESYFIKTHENYIYFTKVLFTNT